MKVLINRKKMILMECIFCEQDEDNIIKENELSFAIFDRYPVNEGHMLIIPKRHFSNFFDATAEEIESVYQLLHECKKLLDEEYQPDGYNIGINVDQAAGQTIMHLHVHLIPRYSGDVDNPRGGIRKLKPNLVFYDG